MIKRILFFLIFFTLISCDNSFKKIESINQIDGKWRSSFETLHIDTEKMILKKEGDSINYILTSRAYDYSQITVSSGSIMFYDGTVFTNYNNDMMKIIRKNDVKEYLYIKID